MVERNNIIDEGLAGKNLPRITNDIRVVLATLAPIVDQIRYMNVLTDEQHPMCILLVALPLRRHTIHRKRRLTMKLPIRDSFIPYFAAGVEMTRYNSLIVGKRHQITPTRDFQMIKCGLERVESKGC